MFIGNYWERNREREIFRLNRFNSRHKGKKSFFCTVLCSESNVYCLQFPLGIVEKHAKKEQVYCSTTEFFVFQQSFYWTRRFDPETLAFFGYIRPIFLNRPIYTLQKWTILPSFLLRINGSVKKAWTYTRRRPEFPGRNVVFNKTIAGRRRTLLLTVKPARMSVKSLLLNPKLSSSSFFSTILSHLQPLRNLQLDTTFRPWY